MTPPQLMRFPIRDIRAQQGLLANWRAYRGLFSCLVARNLKIRLGGIRHLSALGLFLNHFNPIVVIGVYIVVCGGILKVSVPNYPVFVAIGHLHWTFFTTVLSRACGSVYRDSTLIKAARFPYILLTLADLTDQVFEFLITLTLLLLLLPLLGGHYAWTALLYPAVFAFQVLFLGGLSAALSALQGVFQDVGQTLALILRLMFWFTPVIYSAAMVPKRYQAIFTFLNPMALYLGSYRDILCYDRIPDAAHWLAMGLWAALAVFIGHKVFFRLERHLPEAF